jgi:hypothetical protein
MPWAAMMEISPALFRGADGAERADTRRGRLGSGKTSFGTPVSALDAVALFQPSANREQNQLVALAPQSKFYKEAFQHRVGRNPRMMNTQSGHRLGALRSKKEIAQIS